MNNVAHCIVFTGAALQSTRELEGERLVMAVELKAKVVAVRSFAIPNRASFVVLLLFLNFNFGAP